MWIKHAINKNCSLKFEFQGMYWCIFPNLKLCGSHFGLLDFYKHVQRKQPVRITTLNLNFRCFKILLYLGLLAAILRYFGSHVGFLLVHQVLIPQIWIPSSSLYAKNMQSARITASNFSFRMRIGEFCPILSCAATILKIFGGHFGFLYIQKPCTQWELQPQIWDKGCSYVKVLQFKAVLWHSGGHLGFQEMLKGERFTPSWIFFCTIRRTNSWEKKCIRHFHLMAESCCPLPA